MISRNYPDDHLGLTDKMFLSVALDLRLPKTRFHMYRFISLVLDLTSLGSMRTIGYYWWLLMIMVLQNYLDEIKIFFIIGAYTVW